MMRVMRFAGELPRNTHIGACITTKYLFFIYLEIYHSPNATSQLILDDNPIIYDGDDCVH